VNAAGGQAVGSQVDRLRFESDRSCPLGLHAEVARQREIGQQGGRHRSRAPVPLHRTGLEQPPVRLEKDVDAAAQHDEHLQGTPKRFGFPVAIRVRSVRRTRGIPDGEQGGHRHQNVHARLDRLGQDADAAAAVRAVGLDRHHAQGRCERNRRRPLGDSGPRFPVHGSALLQCRILSHAA
jgi:hypothetical protein